MIASNHPHRHGFAILIIRAQLRLIIDESGSNVVLADESIESLVVASSEQTGLKVVDLNLHIDAGVAQALLLDFDLSNLHENPPGFTLNSNAVRGVKLTDAGSVTGSLALTAETVTAADVVATLTIHHAGGIDLIAITQVVLNSSTPTATYVFNGVPADDDYVVTVAVSHLAQSAAFDIPIAPAMVAVTAGGTPIRVSPKLPDSPSNPVWSKTNTAAGAWLCI